MVNVDAAVDVRGCNIVIIIIFPSFLSSDIMQGVELPPLSLSLFVCRGRVTMPSAFALNAFSGEVKTFVLLKSTASKCGVAVHQTSNYPVDDIYFYEPSTPAITISVCINIILINNVSIDSESF